MKLVSVVAAVAIIVTVVMRYRRGPEVWHVAAELPDVGGSAPVSGRI